MNVKDRACLASVFGVPVEIAPFITELLADLWSLGVPPEVLVELLRPVNLPPRTTSVMDLGCGKGAVSITLARDLGFKVDGVDFFPPFIEEARAHAVNLKLSGLCRFSEGDIREIVNKGGNYDIVMLIWVGGVLGTPGESVGNLRRMVRPGGYMVYAEGYLREGAGSDVIRADVTHGDHLSHEEILRELTTHGDMIVRETIVPEDKTRALYTEYIDSLRKGAERITLVHPEYGQSLKDHIAAQEQMCRFLESAVVPAAWLLRKELP